MTSIRKRKHPRHEAWFSELSLGNSSWSGLAGREGDKQSEDILQKAWDAGIRYFDTAPYYGSGLCERRLGHGLVWQQREDYLLSTKVGVNLDPFSRKPGVTRHYPHHAGFTPVCDYSADGIAASFETSLHRLGIPSADIAYMHGLSICDGGMEAALETGMPALLDLREDGRVRMMGVGANTPEIAMAFLERYDIDLLLFAGGFSLADHAGAEAVISLCQERGTGVIAASPFGSGRYFTPENEPFRQKLQARCAEFGISENAAVLQFGMRYPSVLSVLWSTKTLAKVEPTIEASRQHIPDGFWDALVQDGIIKF
ncbi:aldo/keto reductase [Neorhizobium sp. JUb45]|uniref:aldo/keto reductase n=1 Tax=Neorhizobium sp. JUb45 TaxID=2485113 RepID=UPI00104C2E82|nr:aldo/keto reductase [Neorhizobium sp. JUb45]TCR02682.1 D-threo-aldose 1-dehydrogenase [Neorhizobium sp. JUb45]